MLSIGDWVDKLIIENMKIFTTRDKFNASKEDPVESAKLYDLMMQMVDNRAKISNALDEKVQAVMSGKDSKEFIKRIRTYNLK